MSGPCTENGTAPRVDRLTEPQHGRVARRVVGASLAGGDHGVQFGEAGDDRRDRPSPARTLRSATPRRGRASPRPARRCRTRRSPAGGGPPTDDRRPWREPEQLGGPQVQQRREQVACLVAAGDVAGLVLDPHATVGRESQLVGERVGAGERRDAESGSVDRANRVVELADERGPGVGSHAVCLGERRPGQLGVVAHERVGVVGRAQRSHPPHDLQHVVTIAADGPRAPPRQRSGDVDGRRADRAPEADDVQHESLSPLSRRPRALKSLIISSHTPT